jgi:polyphosphate kinase
MLKKFYEYFDNQWATSFSHPQYEPRLFTDEDEEDIKYSIGELEELFDKYKEIFEDNKNIEKLEELVVNELGEYLYDKLKLDFFFRGLEVKQKMSDEEAIEYFDDYIEMIPRRYRKIYKKDFSKYEKPEFEEVKRIKSKLKNRSSYKILNKEAPALFAELTKMLLWVKKNNKKILVSFDGRDTGGKGSIARFIMRNFFASPMGRNLLYRDFGVPTIWQSRNWFHRYKKVLPKECQMVIFDRSWYNRAVNDPVMGYCTKEQYEKFMKEVNPFEKELIEDQDIIYMKFWLSIEKETQELRFQQRQASPIKHFKFSENDRRALEMWDKFTPYIEEMFKKTSTDISPWVVVNMDDKPLGWLNSLRYILNKVPYPNKDQEILDVYPEIVYEVK